MLTEIERSGGNEWANEWVSEYWVSERDKMHVCMHEYKRLTPYAEASSTQSTHSPWRCVCAGRRGAQHKGAVSLSLSLSRGRVKATFVVLPSTSADSSRVLSCPSHYHAGCTGFSGAWGAGGLPRPAPPLPCALPPRDREGGKLGRKEGSWVDE